MFRIIKSSNELLVQEQAKRAVYEERERLARELHDGIAQSLFFLYIKLKQGDTETASRAVSIIDNHVRQSIFNLRSIPEEHGSLKSRITSWLSNWDSMTGIHRRRNFSFSHRHWLIIKITHGTMCKEHNNLPKNARPCCPYSC
ncbi:histidine kinase [Bacillus sp. V5-8f]|uniref:histidine kinase n=1 Tax=Bacillus sp. V5-8f TaxID=2053044 RepID=UPI0021555F30|nr:histidine kinase [Bacillus sp. V5-8f]